MFKFIIIIDYTLPPLQIASAAGAFELNNRQRFAGFFRTIPSYEFVAPSLAQIARQFSWTQMAIITQRESLFTVVSIEMITHCTVCPFNGSPIVSIGHCEAKQNF